VLDPAVDLHPGDGLAFVDGSEVAGTALTTVADRQVFVQDPDRIRAGTRLHRNLDLQWLKALRGAKVERRIPVAARLDFPDGAVRLRLEDPSGLAAEALAPGPCEPARDAGAALQAIRDALGRLGGTPFALDDLRVAEPRFVPASCLNSLRREAAAALEARRREPRSREARRPAAPLGPLPVADLDFTWNIANRAARAFYERAGGKVLEPAAELQDGLKGRVVMTTRHCVKYELGWCPVHANPEPWRRLPEPRGPLFLENGATRLECRFDCRRCRMELVLRERRERG
jgi:putative protease